MKDSELWLTHILSPLNLFSQSEKLSIRPRPLFDESLYSWMLRLAKANVNSLSGLFKRHQIYPYNRIDNQLSNSLIECLNKKTGIPENRLKSLVHINSQPVSELTLKKLRFCPLCFKDDKIQYFRLKWKFRFINACQYHKCLLIDQCPFCHSKILPHRLLWYQSFSTCYNCKKDMSLFSMKRYSPNHYCLKANNYFQEIIYNLETNNSLNFLIKIRYLGLFLFRLFSWRKQYIQRSLKLDNVKKWFLFYGYALFLQNNPEILTELVKTYQSIFNYTIHQCFSKNINSNVAKFFNSFQSKMRRDEIVLPISRDNLKKSIENLQKTGDKITFKNILHQLGFLNDVFQYRTEIPTSELLALADILRKSAEFPIDFFERMDVKKRISEEIEKKEQKRIINEIAIKTAENIDKLILDYLKRREIKDLVINYKSEGYII